jgi:hypothetical protein
MVAARGALSTCVRRRERWRRLLVRVIFVGAVVLMFGVNAAAAQTIFEEYTPVDGFLRIGPEPDRAVPLTQRGHTLILPDSANIQGVVVFVDPRAFPSDGLRLAPGEFETEALSRGVAVLHITTGDPLDFLFRDVAVHGLAERLQEVLVDHGLRETPVFLAGLSLGGTRALRIAAFLRANQGRYWLQPSAAAIVDAPLDMVRLWAAERQAAQLGFHPAAADEGRWVTYLLETHLGGPPAESRSRYVQYSPFVFSAADGGNALHLRDLPVRAYHEPDVDWWIANRRKSYYSMNSIDQAALINQLLILGNNRAELVSTYGRREGYADGASPHTWSIVDNADLIEWFVRQVRR